MSNTKSYTKAVANLGLLRNELTASTILDSPPVVIISLVADSTTVTIGYSTELTTAQDAAVSTLIHNYTDPGFPTQILQVTSVGKGIRMQEEHSTETNGSYMMMGQSFTARGGVNPATGVHDVFPNLTIFPFILDFPYSALNGIVPTLSESEGDIVEGYVLPQNGTVVGACTSDVHDGDIVIHVTDSVLAMVEPDHISRVVLTEMTTGRVCDKIVVISYDFTTKTITLKEPINIEDGQPLVAGNTVTVTLDNNIIGVMTAPNTINNRWINVDPGTLDNTYVGRFFNLFQSNQSRSQLRMVEAIDKTRNRVRVDRPFDIAMDPSVSTVYIQLTIKMISNQELDGVTSKNAGLKTIGGGSLKDVVVAMYYTNNGPGRNRFGDMVSDKRIRCELHILY